MGEMAARLRTLLAEDGMLVVPDCYNVLTARIVESEGFPATYCGGSSIHATHFGLPDHGIVSMSEMIEVSRLIASSISIPLIVDADQGGETSLNVRRTVQGFERAGVAGVHIEDTRNPKHQFARDSRDQLVPISELVGRIAAALEAREDPNFVVIGRTDEIWNGGSVDETIRRGRACAGAGADLFFVPGMNADQLDQIAPEVPIPIVDFRHPVSAANLKVNLMLGGDRIAATAHRDLVRKIRSEGAVVSPENMVTKEEYAELLGDSTWLTEAQRWSDITRS